MSDPHEATCERLMAHRDPVLREIGEQLRRGFTRPRDLLREPAYQRVIEDGLRTIAGLDRERLAASVRAAGISTRHGRHTDPAP